MARSPRIAHLVAAACALALLCWTATQQLAAQSDVPRTRTLVVAYPALEFSLDPLHTFTTTEAQLFTAVYEGLVAYDPITLNPVAGQAERWEISRDRRTYTFYLRPDARFSNGDRLRAEDFRMSWLRILDPGAAAEYSFLFDVIEGVAEYRTGELADAAKVGIRALSDQVLEVELAEPADHFLKVLAHHSFSAIHPGYLGAVNWDRTGQLIGNGPFKVVRWHDRELVLERNEYYWGRGQVELDRVEVRFYDDPQQVTRDFLRGEIHWANVWADSPELRSYLVYNPLFATTYFYFRSDREPFDDKRVRQGLALLLPWDEIRSPERSYFPSAGLVPAIADYPQVEGIRERDERRGLKLLDQAGYAGGRGLPTIDIKVMANSSAARVARTMQEAWEGMLGVDVAVHEFSYRDLLEEIRAGDFALAHQTWVGDFADPLTFLQMWTRTSNLNDAGYLNRQYDRAVGRGVRAAGAERLPALADAEEILLQEAVILPISHMVAFNIVNRGRVDGWYPNALDIHPFRFIRFRRLQGPRGVAAAPTGGVADTGSAVG